MKYNGAVVTSNGSSFLSGLVANKKSAVLDKIIILNTDVPSNKTIDSMTAQDFSNGMSFDINNVSQNDNSFTATSVVSNTGNVNDYPAILVGLFGYYDGSSERTLLSVSKAVDPFVIEKDTGTPVKLSVSITVGFSSSQQINLTVKDDVYLAKKDIDGTMVNLGFAKKNDLNNLATDLTSSFNGKIDDLNKKITNVDTKTPETNAKNYADEIVKNLSDKSIKYQRNLTNDDDLLDVFKFDDGIYELANISPKNAPHTNFSGKYIKLGNGTNSSFNLFTLLCVDETNSTVYMNFCYGWPLTNDGWKKLATDADIKSLVEKIDDLSSKGMVFRGVITDADLNDYNETGFYVYSVNGNKKNAPSENQSGLFFVIGDGQHVKQEIWNMQYGYTLTRGRNESYYWSDWTQTANTNYVDQNIRQVNANITGIQNQVNELNNKSTAQKTTIDYSRSIDSYTQPGTYLGVGMNPASWLGISNWAQNWDFVLKVEVYGDNIIQTIYSERKQYVRTNIRSWVNNQFVNNWHPWRNMTGYDFITDPVDIHSLPNGEYALLGDPKNYGYPVTKFNAWFSYLKVEGIRDDGGEEVKILTYMSPWRDIAYQYYTHIKGWGEWMQPTLYPLN